MEDESADAIDWVFTTAEFAAALSDDLVPRRVMPRKLIEGVPSTGRVLVRVRTDLFCVVSQRQLPSHKYQKMRSRTPRKLPIVKCVQTLARRAKTQKTAFLDMKGAENEPSQVWPNLVQFPGFEREKARGPSRNFRRPLRAASAGAKRDTARSPAAPGSGDLGSSPFGKQTIWANGRAISTTFCIF